MGVHADSWIRRMAREHAMIEPFEEALIRRTADGSPVISYGLSSYGYDLRVAEPVRLTVVSSQAEADMICSLLRANGIACADHIVGWYRHIGYWRKGG